MKPVSVFRRCRLLGLLGAAALIGAACGGGSAGNPGGSGGGGGESSEVPSLSPEDDPPGLGIAITSVDGASGASQQFLPGDVISITFTVTKEDGVDCPLSELSLLRALVSGPTFNYQRVIAETSAPLNGSLDNGDGTHTFQFATPIPTSFLAPFNDTDSFGPEDGELTGQALLSGTYTVGLYGYREYTVESEGFRDIGDATADFLLGTTSASAPRDVAGIENCNNCHTRLEAHGGVRRNLTICLMCHTAGAEDRNVASAAGGTPGVSVDFRIMIHKIHNGSHLPSVLGVTTDEFGARDYTAEPKPYELVGDDDDVHDHSHVGFPVWPSLTEETLRDAGYDGLSEAAQDLEDGMRRGVVACHKCHGDPDGAGPAQAPDNGNLIFLQPTRRTCGSCHDDIVWEHPYVANDDVMPAQTSEADCKSCHPEAGDPLAIRDGHLHPLLDPALNPGLNFLITDLAEAAPDDGDGTIDPGEKVRITFTITDANGVDVDPDDIASMTAAISGPTSNLNLVHLQPFPTDALLGPQPYTINLPEARHYEFVGQSSGDTGDVFTTLGSPHWDSLGAATIVSAVTPGKAGDSNLSFTASALQNFIDVDDPTGFAHDDLIVIDEGLEGTEEYLQVQFVDGQRLWFSSPASSDSPYGLRSDHAAGAPVTVVVATDLSPGVDYDLDEAAGTITETLEIGAAVPVLVSYTTDLIVPEVYPIPLNGSPDLDETWGKWSGKTLVDGTYLLALWGYRSLSIEAYGESNTYRAASMDDATAFVLGAAADQEPWDLISSPDNCHACHDELRFHDGTRGGFDTCLVCHGSAGPEDRPPYVAGNAPLTLGVGIGFRQMLHKIHMGKQLDSATEYTVVGSGSGYPDNFSTHTYEHVGFPAMPDGARDCAACHGASNDAWEMPANRDHPTEQGAPGPEWRNVCSSCHDAQAALAHMQVNTSLAGIEACEVCHGEGSTLNVAVNHKIR